MPHGVVRYRLWHSRFMPILWHSLSWERLQDGQFQLQMSSGLYDSGYVWHYRVRSSTPIPCKRIHDRVPLTSRNVYFRVSNLDIFWLTVHVIGHLWQVDLLSKHLKRQSIWFSGLWIECMRCYRTLRGVNAIIWQGASECWCSCNWRGISKGLSDKLQ